MKIRTFRLFAAVVACVFIHSLTFAQDHRQFKIFQFPVNRIPVINGDNSDWEIVPDSFKVGMNEVWDDSRKHETADPENLDSYNFV